MVFEIWCTPYSLPSYVSVWRKALSNALAVDDFDVPNSVNATELCGREEAVSKSPPLPPVVFDYPELCAVFQEDV